MARIWFTRDNGGRLSDISLVAASLEVLPLRKIYVKIPISVGFFHDLVSSVASLLEGESSNVG